MRSEFFTTHLRAAVIVGLSVFGASSMAEPQHGIAMYGDPALPPDFVALPYANPDAPIGGRMVEANVGNFDSLNPFIQKGNVPWQLRFVYGETLMGRSIDEPFSLYGILAESIETGPNREWVEFTLRPEARFSDGSPVTVEDVIWSFEILGTAGHGRYRGFWAKVDSLEQVGDRTIRFTFNEENAELALLAGMRPILQKAQFDGVDFAEEGDKIVPITSSPYIIDDYEFGRFVSFRRNPDYWGWGVVPFRAGTFNLDEYRIEFFGDETAAFEAIKTGLVNTTREFNAARWESQYDFAAVQDGRFVKEELAHQRPSGMTGFVMNTRRTQFQDWRVREALLTAFNFEFANEAMTGSQQQRITSYWSNSPLGMGHGPAEGRVRDMLMLYQDDLLPGALEGYNLPQSDGSERNRAGTARAMELFEEAGYTIQDGVMADANGTPFTFDILIQSGASETSTIADIYVESLKRIGVSANVTQIDSAQFTERTRAYDFDMTYYRVGVSLSPGNEQYLYFGADQVDTGGRNLMGVSSPAVDGLIGEMLTAESQEDFRAAIKALDRTLMSGRYVIPFYQWNITRIAHDANLHHPDYIPVLGDWPGWQPDVWWYEEN
ncbi:extracellular solute-binding protein [Marivivens marinus]|uniref:extracellular solute-binding protein n=1 Tax=Marivivens marinus TaxID=3110173 RepID=UPI003B8460AB